MDNFISKNVSIPSDKNMSQVAKCFSSPKTYTTILLAVKIFSTNTIYLIKETLSMFITLSFQLFKNLSLFQHLVKSGFNASVNSGLPKTM